MGHSPKGCNELNTAEGHVSSEYCRRSGRKAEGTKEGGERGRQPRGRLRAAIYIHLIYEH